jgi:Fe-S cluster assembly iron-binding protein IscA
MDITAKALRHIQRMRSRKSLPKSAGVRLDLAAGSVCLKWESAGPRREDLVVREQDLPIFMDAQTYLRLADYELDLERDGDRPRFLLRPRPSIALK